MRSGRFLFWLIMVPVCGSTGLIYAAIFHPPQLMAPVIYAAIIGSAVVAFERGLMFGALQHRIRRLPTLIYVPLAEIAYIALIVCGNAVAGLFLWGTGLVKGTFAEAVLTTPQVLIYALVVSAILVFMIRVRDLIGSDALVSLLIGRYHRPVVEERIFLFIDVIGSTAYAERHGDLAAQNYLGAFFATLADPVRRHGGAIDDYVGDMALVTWPLAKGVSQARCVACVFDIAAGIARDGAEWRKTYGQVPEFRAALHGGPVVTAEIGVDRHKISYFGDCVNTTARIETLCRSLNAPILISSALLDQLPALPPGIRALPLGEHVVKGRDQRLTVLALERAASLMTAA